MSFVAAPMRLGPRDRWLGWSDRARGGAHRPHRVAGPLPCCLPGVRVQHLASHALKLARQALTAGWKNAARPCGRCCWRPASTGSTRGVCYRARGLEAGGPHPGAAPPGRTDAVDRKRVFVLKLGKGGPRPAVRRAAAQAGLLACAAPPSASFAEREFGRSDLPRRAPAAASAGAGRGLGEAARNGPADAVPGRHPSARRPTASCIIRRWPPPTSCRPHREALAERCRRQGTVLLVQDTTTLNWTRLKDSSRGLGPLQKRSDSSRGLFVHAALAFTEGRRPLGVSGLESWARPLQEPSDEREKESARWLRGFEQALEVGARLPPTRG